MKKKEAIQELVNKGHNEKEVKNTLLWYEIALFLIPINLLSLIFTFMGMDLSKTGMTLLIAVLFAVIGSTYLYNHLDKYEKIQSYMKIIKPITIILIVLLIILFIANLSLILAMVGQTPKYNSYRYY